MCREQIRSLLHDELGLDTETLLDDAPLISNGLIDSFAMVTLMGALERAFGIRISPSEVALDNLDSVEKLGRFIRTKQQQ